MSMTESGPPRWPPSAWAMVLTMSTLAWRARSSSSATSGRYQEFSGTGHIGPQLALVGISCLLVRAGHHRRQKRGHHLQDPGPCDTVGGAARSECIPQFRLESHRPSGVTSSPYPEMM